MLLPTLYFRCRRFFRHFVVVLYLFKKYPTPCHRCFVVLMMLLLFSLLFIIYLRDCVIIFVWFSILHFLLSVVVVCLRVVAQRVFLYVFSLLPPLEILHYLEIVDWFVFFIIDFWFFVSSWFCFVVSSWFLLDFVSSFLLDRWYHTYQFLLLLFPVSSDLLLSLLSFDVAYLLVMARCFAAIALLPPRSYVV